MWDFFLYGGKHHKLHIQSPIQSFFTFFAFITMWIASLGLFMLSIYNIFPTLYDVCGLFRWHWISLSTKSHCILIRISVCTQKNITPLPTCMDAHDQCSSVIWVKSCSKWSITSWQYFVIIGKFTLLVCHLTKLEIWLGMLLVLWPNFKILCMMIIFSFIFGVERISLTLSWNTSWMKWLKNNFS